MLYAVSDRFIIFMKALNDKFFHTSEQIFLFHGNASFFRVLIYMKNGCFRSVVVFQGYIRQA